MENYDPNSGWFVHTVRLTFQQWEFTYSEDFEVRGNVKGKSVLDSAFDQFVDKYEDIAFEKLEEDPDREGYFVEFRFKKYLTSESVDGNRDLTEENVEYLETWFGGDREHDIERDAENCLVKAEIISVAEYPSKD